MGASNSVGITCYPTMAASGTTRLPGLGHPQPAATPTASEMERAVGVDQLMSIGHWFRHSDTKSRTRQRRSLTLAASATPSHQAGANGRGSSKKTRGRASPTMHPRTRSTTHEQIPFAQGGGGVQDRRYFCADIQWSPSFMGLNDGARQYRAAYIAKYKPNQVRRILSSATPTGTSLGLRPRRSRDGYTLEDTEHDA